MAAPLKFTAVIALSLATAGCASQYGGAYDVDSSSGLGGPRTTRMAEARPRSYEPAPQSRASAPPTVEHRYVYRGGRDPVTGKAYIQEGPSR